MSKIALSGDSSGTGTFTIASPNSNSNYTLNLPTATGTINTSGAVNEVPAGSASAPSIYPTGDTNTGIFFPAADTIAFTEGGAEAMRIDSSGNLLVGTTTSPAGSGNIQVSAATKRIGYYEDGSHDGYMVPYDGSGFTNFYNTFSTGGLRFFTGTSGGAERMRLDSSGNLLVGTTNSSASAGEGVKLRSNGVVYSVAATAAGDNYNYYNTTVGLYRFYVTSGGTINATSTTITAISDQRLKENIQDIDVGLDAVMALKPRKFDWKAGKGKDKKGDRGWIAQEFEQVFPEMIDTWKDPAPEGEEPYKAVNADLIPILVKAIQEQQALITSLTSRIAALEAKE